MLRKHGLIFEPPEEDLDTIPTIARVDEGVSFPTSPETAEYVLAMAMMTVIKKLEEGSPLVLADIHQEDETPERDIGRMRIRLVFSEAE